MNNQDSAEHDSRPLSESQISLILSRLTTNEKTALIEMLKALLQNPLPEQPVHSLTGEED